MKRLREARGWSQRDLAAKSGVTQNTISQLERGERKAMPSTVRKLADALGVKPPVLMAESRIDTYIPHEQKAVSRAPSEDRVSQQDRGLRYQALIGFLGAPDEFLDKRQKEELQGLFERKIAADERLPKRQKEELQELLERMGAGWAERFVSGDLMMVDESVVYSLLSYPEDRDVARSRLASSDPKEIVKAAQLVLHRAKKIVEEYDSHLQSFNRIPDHYYADPAALSRIQMLQEALSERRQEAAEAVQELMDLYHEILDALEDQILEMRKESDVLEAFVTQAHDWER